MLRDIFQLDFFDATARSFLEHGADAKCILCIETAPL